MRMRRLKFLACVLAGLATGAAQAQTQTQAKEAQPDYPTRPIRIVVPFATAGSTDLLARVVAAALSKELGQPVTVDNRPGASGNIGADAVAKAAPDGYTLLYTSSNLTANPAVMTVPYDVVRDFTPVSRVAFLPLVLIRSSQVPASTVPELITAMRAQPGAFNFSSSGVGGAPHLAGELLKSAAGVDMTHVPYNGAGPALNDVAAGRVQLTFTTFTSAQALLKSQRVAAVAVANPKRLGALPGVPTFEEGGLKGLEIGTMNGLLAPARTPAAVVDKIYAALKRAAESPDFKAQFREQGADLLLESPAAFSAHIPSDLRRWRELTTRAGVQPGA